MRKRNLGLEALRPWYPLELPITYEGPHRYVFQGDGRTIAISSGGVRFDCRLDLPVGLHIRVAIEWPAKLGDGASLYLSATGRIQSSNMCEIEIVIVRHEFRIRRNEGGKPLIMMDAASAGSNNAAAGHVRARRSRDDDRPGEVALDATLRRR